MTFILSRSRANGVMSGSELFDCAGTLARLGGDRALMADLIRFFLEDSTEILGHLKETCAAGDAAAAERAAHSLRGICANFGAKEAIDLCWVIERRSLVGDWNEARGALAQLEDALRRLRAALEKALQE